MTRTAADVIAFAKEHGARNVDLKFVDFPGTWQHFSIPVSELNEGVFEEGCGFDGSSIRGWQAINESDMLVVPDPATAQIDPFMSGPTLTLICDIRDPVTGQSYTRDPRHVCTKALDYLRSTGIADTAFIGPEPEFFVFDDVRFDQTPNSAFFFVDSVEGRWNTGEDVPGGNLAYHPRYKEGYFPVPPFDTLQDIRTEIVDELEKLGFRIECHHHEVATAGQCEIDMRFAPMLEMADQLMWFKYVVKNVARRHGKTATFMPKPIFEDNGSGMHTHISLWKDDEPLFWGNSYANLSETAMHFIAGIIAHGPALCAFANPTTVSYKRLVPGFEAPINLAYSSRNRSAAVRIPMYSQTPQSKRVEFRTPDPSCNPYLTFPAMLLAGLDGVERRLDPGQALDRDIYGMTPAELKAVPKVPSSLDEALTALGEDHAFLLKGDVFTEDVVKTWIDYKMDREVTAILSRPTPFEFSLYYDC